MAAGFTPYPNTTDCFAMALFLEFLAQEWILTLALLVVIVMLVLHEARKSGPSVSPQQAIGLINSEHGVFLDFTLERLLILDVNYRLFIFERFNNALREFIRRQYLRLFLFRLYTFQRNYNILFLFV